MRMPKPTSLLKFSVLLVTVTTSTACSRRVLNTTDGSLLGNDSFARWWYAPIGDREYDAMDFHPWTTAGRGVS